MVHGRHVFCKSRSAFGGGVLKSAAFQDAWWVINPRSAAVANVYRCTHGAKKNDVKRVVASLSKNCGFVSHVDLFKAKKNSRTTGKRQLWAALLTTCGSETVRSMWKSEATWWVWIKCNAWGKKIHQTSSNRLISNMFFLILQWFSELPYRA